MVYALSGTYRSGVLIWVCVHMVAVNFISGIESMYFHIALVVLLAATGTNGADETRQEIERYKELSKVVKGLLKSENCPLADESTFLKRADVAFGLDNIELEAQKKIYENLGNRLIECRKQKLKTTTMPSPTIAVNPDVPPTECENAISLTESWRNDHSGSNSTVDGKWNCDPPKMVAAGRPWFRFSGKAGSHLLDKCIPYNSCGTQQPMWTDAAMPKSVGVITPVEVYTTLGRYCKWWTRKVSVIRCSTNANDFVYRYDDDSVDCRLPLGFCGIF